MHCFIPSGLIMLNLFRRNNYNTFCHWPHYFPAVGSAAPSNYYLVIIHSQYFEYINLHFTSSFWLSILFNFALWYCSKTVLWRSLKISLIIKLALIISGLSQTFIHLMNIYWTELTHFSFLRSSQSDRWDWLCKHKYIYCGTNAVTGLYINHHGKTKSAFINSAQRSWERLIRTTL